MSFVLLVSYFCIIAHKITNVNRLLHFLLEPYPDIAFSLRHRIPTPYKKAATRRRLSMADDIGLELHFRYGENKGLPPSSRRQQRSSALPFGGFESYI